MKPIFIKQIRAIFFCVAFLLMFSQVAFAHKRGWSHWLNSGKHATVCDTNDEKTSCLVSSGSYHIGEFCFCLDEHDNLRLGRAK